MREHLVVGVRLDVLIGPCVAAAVGDRAVGSTDRWELLLPAAQVVGGAVDEDNGLAVALLSVREAGPVDSGGADSVERAGAHVAAGLGHTGHRRTTGSREHE